jgi:hypothetical protein
MATLNRAASGVIVLPASTIQAIANYKTPYPVPKKLCYSSRRAKDRNRENKSENPV